MTRHETDHDTVEPIEQDGQIAELNAQLAEITADLQKVQAEFLNYKRRAAEELAAIRDSAKADAVLQFLTVRDSFDSELANRPADAKDTPAATSIDAIRAQFDQVLRNLGAERYESAGHEFDHHLHEALADAGGEGNYQIVADELQAGYRFAGKVIRPAMVRVAHTATPPAGTKATAQTEPTADILAAEKAAAEPRPTTNARGSDC